MFMDMLFPVTLTSLDYYITNTSILVDKSGSLQKEIKAVATFSHYPVEGVLPMECLMHIIFLIDRCTKRGVKFGI